MCLTERTGIPLGPSNIYTLHTRRELFRELHTVLYSATLFRTEYLKIIFWIVFGYVNGYNILPRYTCLPKYVPLQFSRMRGIARIQISLVQICLD